MPWVEVNTDALNDPRWLLARRLGGRWVTVAWFRAVAYCSTRAGDGEVLEPVWRALELPWAHLDRVQSALVESGLGERIEGGIRMLGRDELWRASR